MIGSVWSVGSLESSLKNDAPFLECQGLLIIVGVFRAVVMQIVLCIEY